MCAFIQLPQPRAGLKNRWSGSLACKKGHVAVNRQNRHIARMWNSALLRALRVLELKQELIMATLATVQDQVNTLATDVNTMIADLKTAQAGPDQTAIDAISTSLTNVQTAVTAALTPVTPPAPPAA